MKTSGVFAQKEKGQVLVFAALIFLLVIIPLAALFVDGSTIMLNKRQAQAAADAGALAGTRKLCEKSSVDVVIYTATTDYAISKNHATTASASVNGWQVQVNTTVSRPSFFAKLIGIPELTSSATATAACLFPSNNVLPVAFNCPGGPADGCGVSMFPYDPLNPNKPPDSKLYLLVEASGSLPNLCTDATPIAGTMICDATTTTSDAYTPIGKTVRVLGDGARTYVPDLCGSVPVGNCVRAIFGDTKPPATTIPVDPWVKTSDGVKDVFYGALAANIPPSHVFLVPFYTDMSGSYAYITMAAQFMVTCVTRQPQDEGCPGKKAWLDANLASKANGAFTMEGYFVSNYPVNLSDPGSGGTANLGVYYVSLIH